MTTGLSPTFRDPPVVETALSIQFADLRGFQTIHFGKYHSTIEDRFPIAEDQPRLDPIRECFPPVRLPAFRIEPADTRPGRVWFKDAPDGCKLLQLQPDRFGFNWCRRPAQDYPRFEANRPLLFEEFDRFREFADRHDLGEINPNLCEVTYVNCISPVEGESPSECFSAVFHGIRWESADGWLPQPPDAVSLNRVFTIGERKGRLYAEATIASDKARGEFILLKLTARVVHDEGEDLRGNLDLAHAWVVNGFVSLTNEDIRRERWGQEP